MPSRTIQAEKFNAKGITIGTMDVNFNEIGPVTYITIAKAEGGNSTRLCVKTEDLRAALIDEEEELEPEAIDPVDESIRYFNEILGEISTIQSPNYKAQQSVELYQQYRVLRKGIKDGSVTVTVDQVTELKKIAVRILSEGLGVSEEEISRLTDKPGTDSVEEPK